MLLKKVSLLLMFAVLLTSFTMAGDPPKHKFIGVKKCGMCHKKDKTGNQLKIWKESKHANAFKTLQTDKAKEVAKAKGIENPAEAKECLVCHATAYDVDKKFHGKDFKVEEGIQCESCHGAGDEYKSMKTMKDHAKSVAAGMTEYKDEAAIKAQCETCHNDKSPTFKAFDFKARWAEIAHPTKK